jgi:single-stranded-DNA-specific exonuclease
MVQRLALPDLLGRILAARGIGLDHAEEFLAPTLRALLPDPSVLHGMDAAADRLAHAVRAGQTVAVFGDYDVDGACAGAVLALFLRALGTTTIGYVPDRLTEGYGPNANALRHLAESGAALIVCVDCGTAAADALASIHNQADVLVLDHHKSDTVPPTAHAVVNPNAPPDTSGLGQLCAAGVTFLTVVATLRALRRAGFFATRKEPDLRDLLDLVALATVCDMMPLAGLNRAFVTQGLKVMARASRPGIAALMRAADSRDPIPSATTCGFVLGPRINAGGRIAQADLGLRLLLAEDPAEAEGLASALDAINRQRQSVEAGILDAALEEADRQCQAGRAVLLIAQPQWHSGVVGIVAGRVKERFNRPSCVAAIADGVARGSGRSVAGHDLGAAITEAQLAGLLLTGGGHAMACGFSAAEVALDRLHDFLDQRLNSAALLPKAADLDLDATLPLGAATLETARQIERLAPFGQGNPEPLFLVPRAQVTYAERLGRDGNTVRVQLRGEDGTKVKAIAFRAGQTSLGEALLARAGPLHLAGHLRAESWNGRAGVSLFVVDAAVP